MMRKWLVVTALGALLTIGVVVIGCQSSGSKAAPRAAAPAGRGETRAPAAAPASTRPTATAKAVYTCPMHPQVRVTKPGACPQCGMDLVARQP